MRADPPISVSLSLIIFEMYDFPDPGTPRIKITILDEENESDAIVL